MNNKRVKNGLTEVLYEDDAYAKECNAKVLECRKVLRKTGEQEDTVYGIVLDRTVFFSEGGGQPADKGWINETEVLDVQKDENVILHYTKEPFDAGTDVVAKLDFAVRYERMQNHSGEHLFCGLIHKLYGYENVGFHMSKDSVTVDVNGVLGAEDFARLEKLANEGVDADAEIKAVYPDSPEELEYRSKLDLTEDIRVVIIEGYDACACCAPHVKRTGEIGLIKVMDFMSHRGGTRFTLKSGAWAREDYGMLHEEICDIMRTFSAKREECHVAAERVSEQLKSQQETITLLKKQITDLHIDKLHASVKNSGTSRVELIFAEALDEVQMRALINEGVTIASGIVAGFMGKDGEGYRYIISKNETVIEPDLRLLAKEMNEALNGRGGGSIKMIQGSVCANRADIEEYLYRFK
ncbi:MAG: alanyl-tRNA editing protein [Lachnospiraceae bacterium]|nr:alanyl-tRNA editing protein [Lachnospiraceae bacterium]